MHTKHQDEQVFIDVISGAVAFNDRPQALIREIEAENIDYLSCESIDKIGRDAFNIQSTIQYFSSKGVNLKWKI